MITLGYALSSEEHGPDDLVRYAERAETSGFEFALVSDHFHPWTSTQGESPFVWSVLGGIAAATDDLRVGTGVTCPIGRIHPAIVAQAAGTVGTMLPDRFFLGVGTGENLNEHVLGEKLPAHEIRMDMLGEAVEIIRRLWQGGELTYDGEHFTVENARLFTLPAEPPPIHVAASGPGMANVAGEFGDGLVSTAPEPEVVDAFRETADDGGPRYGQVTVCWDEDEQSAVETALRHWPNAALPGELGQVLPTPAHFEQAVQLVDEDDIREAVVCGPDVQRHVDAIGEFVDAGFDHVYVHQVGPDQAAFFDVFEDEIRPSFG